MTMTFLWMAPRGDVLPGLFVAAVLLLAGCGAEATPPTPSAATAPPVQVAAATARTAPIPIRASGRLASKAEIQLAFKIDGVVERIRVDEGDRVRRGEELARLNLAEISAQVMEAESALEKARRDLDRTRRLHRDSVATLEQLQDARTAVDVAAARLQSARFNRQYAVIEAPEAGRILRRRAEEGEYVGPGRPVLTLGAVGRGWVVRAGLPAADIVRVAPGDSARVVFDAHPGRPVAARVTEIADAATPRTGTYEVELSLSAPEVALKSGFVGRVVLHPSGDPASVEIPAAALVAGTGQRGWVYRYDPTTQTVRRQPITVRRLLDRTVLVADGLSPGDSVVVRGAQRLADGDSVRVVEGRFENSRLEGGRLEDGKLEDGKVAGAKTEDD
jgi:RND family efflux transporter MFP subunit